MLPAPFLAIALATAPLSCDSPFSAPAVSPWRPHNDSLAATYARGAEWEGFLERVRARRDTWVTNYQTASVDATLVERIARVPGSWRFLVVAVDSCGDSANTIPYLARLVEASDRLKMRILTPSDGGQWVMDAHRTEDGRAATPTVVLLDETGAERGCWIERPYALRKVVADLRAGVTSGNLVETITAWRHEDQGRSTLDDLVSLLEAAAAGGAARCP